MPVNPYDDCKVSLRRVHRNGDLDIVRASYTRREANVTEALMMNGSLMKVKSIPECPLEHSAIHGRLRQVYCILIMKIRHWICWKSEVNTMYIVNNPFI